MIKILAVKLLLLCIPFISIGQSPVFQLDENGRGVNPSQELDNDPSSNGSDSISMTLHIQVFCNLKYELKRIKIHQIIRSDDSSVKLRKIKKRAIAQITPEVKTRLAKMKEKDTLMTSRFIGRRDSGVTSVSTLYHIDCKIPKESK